MEDRSILARPDPPSPTLDIDYGDVYTPPLEAPRLGKLAFIHGGFWRPEYDRVHARWAASSLRDQGWEVVSLEYPRVPGDPDATVNAIRNSLEFLRPDVVMGHSAGGHLALWAAATLDLRCAALAPVADLRLAEKLALDDDAVAAFLGRAAAERADLDPIQMPGTGATLIHGVDDSVVPIGLSRAYAKAHPDARLVELSGIAHFEVIDPLSDAWPNVIAELRRLLA